MVLSTKKYFIKNKSGKDKTYIDNIELTCPPLQEFTAYKSKMCHCFIAFKRRNVLCSKRPLVQNPEFIFRILHCDIQVCMRASSCSCLNECVERRKSTTVVRHTILVQFYGCSSHSSIRIFILFCWLWSCTIQCTLVRKKCYCEYFRIIIWQSTKCPQKVAQSIYSMATQPLLAYILYAIISNIA